VVAVDLGVGEPGLQPAEPGVTHINGSYGQRFSFGEDPKKLVIDSRLFLLRPVSEKFNSIYENYIFNILGFIKGNIDSSVRNVLFRYLHHYMWGCQKGVTMLFIKKGAP